MLTCPKCHLQVEEPATFCDNCGARLPQAAPSPQAAPKLQASPILQAPQSTGSELHAARAQQPASGSTDSGSFTHAICSACGFANYPGEMFCRNCGVQLAPVSSVPPPLPKPLAAPAPARDVPVAAPDPVAAAQPLPVIEESDQSRPLAGKLVLQTTKAEIPLPAGKTDLVIGRSDPVKNIYPDIDLANFGGEAAGISRSHARLLWQDAQVYIEDLNSTNYTFLNQQRLEANQRYTLNPGDELRLGLLALVYLSS